MFSLLSTGTAPNVYQEGYGTKVHYSLYKLESQPNVHYLLLKARIMQKYVGG